MEMVFLCVCESRATLESLNHIIILYTIIVSTEEDYCLLVVTALLYID